MILKEILDKHHYLRSNQEAVLYRRVTFLAVDSRVEEALWEVDLLASDAEAAVRIVVVESSRHFQDQEACAVADKDAAEDTVVVEEEVTAMGLQRQLQQDQKEAGVARQQHRQQHHRFHFLSPVLAAYWFVLPEKERSQSPFCLKYC